MVIHAESLFLRSDEHPIHCVSSSHSSYDFISFPAPSNKTSRKNIHSLLRRLHPRADSDTQLDEKQTNRQIMRVWDSARRPKSSFIKHGRKRRQKLSKSQLTKGNKARDMPLSSSSSLCSASFGRFTKRAEAWEYAGEQQIVPHDYRQASPVFFKCLFTPFAYLYIDFDVLVPQNVYY